MMFWRERVFLALFSINIITPIGVGRKYDELEIEIGVVKLKLFSNSQFDFSKLDILFMSRNRKWN